MYALSDRPAQGLLRQQREACERLWRTKRVHYGASRVSDGRPPRYLIHHDLIANAAVSSHNQWPFDRDDETSTLAAVGRILADNTSAIVSLMQANLGIGRINNVIGEELAVRGMLTQVLQNYEDTTEFDISAVALVPRNRVPKIHVCLDFLSECFRGFREGS